MLYDLTCPYPAAKVPTIVRTDVHMKSGHTDYTGLVYDVTIHSMDDSSYIDFPGHIVQTDDGMRADNAPAELFFRIPCTVIRLARIDHSGGVSAAELEEALGGIPQTPTLMINALGNLDPDEIEFRSVWLDDSAVDWIVSSGIRILVSDIYESMDIRGIFVKFFRNGICTVCEPRGMGRLKKSRNLLTISFPRIATLTQVPCQILVEEED